MILPAWWGTLQIKIVNEKIRADKDRLKKLEEEEEEIEDAEDVPTQIFAAEVVSGELRKPPKEDNELVR